MLLGKTLFTKPGKSVFDIAFPKASANVGRFFENWKKEIEII
jgi:hypothetical protein